MDEHIFHECMSQPALTLHPNPKSVLIAGGGEGATLREALTHNAIERAVMVNIDEELIDMVKVQMPESHQGAFDDKRTELLHMDARKYLEETDEKFDVIPSDLPNPLEVGPAVKLFTREYFELCRGRLTDDGVFALQAGCANMNDNDCYAACAATVGSVFPVVRPNFGIITTFLTIWGFCLGSKKRDPLDLAEAEDASRLSARGVNNRFFTPRYHRSVITLPDYLNEAIEKKGFVMTNENPFYLTAKSIIGHNRHNPGQARNENELQRSKFGMPETITNDYFWLTDRPVIRMTTKCPEARITCR